MTHAEVKKAVLEMPRAERLEILRTAWESFSSRGDLPVSSDELALIDERIREHEADPDEGIPWEEVKAELWPKQ